ncbi:class I SAM-dependent methyltransferase [Amycolatopsis palatopharyngis]|uniref:class I SAM-dependent methyltransferase n=1 Tax=Amycolatopsis palatopharyngis TaxID=187982 RepID=UPI000E255B89|nr:class I SAM-dependent methyltransferase [Amycolatopsis palatopharyngis]
MNEQFWDNRYRSSDQVFSGNPNGVLVTEVADLPPGQALDVGCGEGADALWLASRGWRVTAADISKVALQRAAAADVAGSVAWTRADLTVEPPPAAAFDLVSMHYFPLPQQRNHTGLRGLLDAVASGGTLLVGSHDLTDLPPHHERGFDPDDYYRPDDIVRLLDDSWTVLVNETRSRTAPAPAGTHHLHDIVLRAQRTR